MYFEFSYNAILIAHRIKFCDLEHDVSVPGFFFFLLSLPPTSTVVYVEYSAGMLNIKALTASDFRKGFEYALIKS